MKKSVLTSAIGLVGALGLAGVANATENPFELTELDSGYQLAEHHEEGEKSDDEGKCGEEGKCGGTA